MQARANAEALRDHTDRELEDNFDLAERVQQVDLPPGTIISDRSSRTPSPGIGGTPHENATDTSEVIDEPDLVPDANESLQLTFSQVLEYCKPYQRTHDLEVDAVSHISTTRSHGWSLLSGFSSSQ